MPDREDTLARMEKIMARVDKLEEYLDRIHELLNWALQPEENNDG